VAFDYLYIFISYSINISLYCGWAKIGVNILLAGVLPIGMLLATEGEMVFAVSELLEKREKIPPESATLGEEKVLPSSGALLVLWYSWHLFSSVDWAGGHRHLCF
jgi:hypothetical protein